MDYFPETGKLFWRVRPARHFKQGKRWTAKQIADKWNKKYAGKEAFTTTDVNGYKQGAINKIGLYAHRVIYAWMTGKWPEQIDHDNGKRSCNIWGNLIPSNNSHNNKNLKKYVTNTSGLTGIRKIKNKWRARIGVDNKEIYLGTYSRKRDAIAARRDAEIKYGFSSRHGKSIAA